MNPKNNRSITDHDRLVAKNTKAIYATNKKALGLTLVRIAEKLNITQSAVSQYLNANIAMGTEIIILFSDILKVDSLELDPKFEERVKVQTSHHIDCSITIIGSTSGLPPKVQTATPPTELPRSIYGVIVDSDIYDPVIEEGTIIGAWANDLLSKGDSVLIRRLEEACFEIMKFIKCDDNIVELTSILSKYHSEKLNNLHFGSEFSTLGKVSIPKDEIITMHKVFTSFSSSESRV